MGAFNDEWNGVKGKRKRMALKLRYRGQKDEAKAFRLFYC